MAHQHNQLKPDVIISISTPSSQTMLTAFLNHIKSILNLEGQNKVRTGILLSSYSHALVLIYQAKTDSWHFMDINQWPEIECKADQLDDVVSKIIHGFNSSSKNLYTAFDASVITTANMNSQPELFTTLNTLQVTKEIAQREAEDSITLTYKFFITKIVYYPKKMRC